MRIFAPSFGAVSRIVTEWVGRSLAVKIAVVRPAAPPPMIRMSGLVVTTGSLGFAADR